MNKIEELKLAFAKYKYGAGQLTGCVDWAVERLVKVEEEDDMDIFLLAGSTNESEIVELVQDILSRYLDAETFNEEFCAGQLLICLYDSYHAKTISIIELEPIISSMYLKLPLNPDWLAMLNRNCEVSIILQTYKPFEDEFKYITDLWKEAKTLDDFKKKYDRQISNTHDFDWQ